MNGIQHALERWKAIKTKSQINGVIVGIVVLVIIGALVLFTKQDAIYIVGGIVIVLGVLAAVMSMIGKRKTGLQMNPEWKPLEIDDDSDEFGEEATEEPTGDTAADYDGQDEPIRRLDAQILGDDLTKLGQIVTPRMSRTYAMGWLVLQDEMVRWEPSSLTASQGIEVLESEPAEVISVERAPLWGSWSLVRIARSDGSEWCMRVPNSADLRPAFRELGLSLHDVTAQ